MERHSRHNISLTSCREEYEGDTRRHEKNLEKTRKKAPQFQETWRRTFVIFVPPCFHELWQVARILATRAQSAKFRFEFRSTELPHDSSAQVRKDDAGLKAYTRLRFGWCGSVMGHALCRKGRDSGMCMGCPSPEKVFGQGNFERNLF